MALASKGPIGSWSPMLQKLSGQAHPVLPRSLENTQVTLAHAHVHADARRRAHAEWRACTECAAFLPFTVLFYGGLSQGSTRPWVGACDGVCSWQGA